MARQRSQRTLVLGVLLLGVWWMQPARAWTVLEDEAEGPFVVRGRATVTDPASVDFHVMINGDNGAASTRYYHVHVHGRRAAISKVNQGIVTLLSLEGEVADVAPGTAVEFAIYRDAYRITLIWARQVVAKAYDTEFKGPAVGYLALAGAQVEDAVLQLLEPVNVTDTFEKEEGEEALSSQWEVLSGNWRLQSLREDPQAGNMRADYSANAFSYFGSGDGPALATMGMGFWRDCEYAAAVRAHDEKTVVGLAFYVQDADNYLLLRWDNRFTPSPDGPHLRLIAVVNGEPQVLAERESGYFPNQWHELRVQVCDDRIRCLVDGVVALEAATTLFGCGPLGLYVEGKNGAWFDDVAVVSWHRLAEDFAHGEPGKWLAVSGQWQIGGGVARPTGSGRNLLVTGDPGWQKYSVSAEVQARSGGTGLIGAYRGPDEYLVFRWAPVDSQVPYAGKAQLVGWNGESELLLAERPVPEKSAQPLRAAVVVETNYAAGLLNGEMVVDAVVPGLGGGQVGLYADDPGDQVFQGVEVEPLPRPRLARVTREFTDTKQHFEMAAWASTRHAWVPPAEADNPKVWWTKGDYYGPLELRFSLTQLGEVEGTMHVGISAEPDRPHSGAGLDITARQGSRVLALRLTAGGREVGTAQVEAQDETCPISFERRGRNLLVTVDGNVVISAPWETDGPSSTGDGS